MPGKYTYEAKGLDRLAVAICKQAIQDARQRGPLSHHAREAVEWMCGVGIFVLETYGIQMSEDRIRRTEVKQ